MLHFIAAKRLAAGRLTVVDATNVQPEARKPLVELARQYHCLPVAIVLDLPEAALPGAQPRPSRAQTSARTSSASRCRSCGGRCAGCEREGFRHVFVLGSPEEVETATVERQPLWNDRTARARPVRHHRRCSRLLRRAGSTSRAARLRASATERSNASLWGGPVYVHPAGRKAVFVGDLVDRGPRILDTVRLVRNMVQAGSALCVPGNHDMKLMRKLRGKDVQITHGLADTLAEIDALPEDVRGPFAEELADFLDGLVSHYVLDDGKLVVAHAGMKEEMQGRGSGKVRDFALYGETTGETDEFGLPVRCNWAAEYRGRAMSSTVTRRFRSRSG